MFVVRHELLICKAGKYGGARKMCVKGYMVHKQGTGGVSKVPPHPTSIGASTTTSQPDGAKDGLAGGGYNDSLTTS
jgi:hypothetical protein